MQRRRAQHLRIMVLEKKKGALGLWISLEKNWSLPLWAKEKEQNVLFTSRSHLKKSSCQRLFYQGVEGGRIKVHNSRAIFLRFASTLNLTLSGFWVFLRTKSIFKGEMCCHWGFSVVFPWLRQQRQSKNSFCLQENQKSFCPKQLLQNRKLIIN